MEPLGVAGVGRRKEHQNAWPYWWSQMTPPPLMTPGFGQAPPMPYVDLAWPKLQVQGMDAPHARPKTPPTMSAAIDPAEVGDEMQPAEWMNVTTVMMRNLPNKYSQMMLVEEINNEGFLGAYDFLYLPIDQTTKANRGYAFINFVTPNRAWVFAKRFEGRPMSRFNSLKVVTVAPASIQGFESNHAHYSNARVNRGDPACRPLFFREPSGGAGPRKQRRRRGSSGILNASMPLPARTGGHIAEEDSDEYEEDEEPDVFAPQPRAPVAAPATTAAVAPPKPAPVRAAQPQAAAEAAPPREASAARFCPFCGGSRKAEFKFCQYCGQSFVA